MTIKSDSFNKNKTTIKKSDSVLSIMELILQCVLFESFILMEYMGVFLINDSRVYMCLWVIPAVIFAYYTRRKIKKFKLMRKRYCYFRNKVVLYNYQKTLCAKGKKKQLKK